MSKRSGRCRDEAVPAGDDPVPRDAGRGVREQGNATTGRRERYDVRLAELTTLRLGGPAKRLVEVDGAGQLIEAVRSADGEAEPLLVLGDGSNLVVADEGFAGTVVRSDGGDVEVEPAGDAVVVRVSAGVNWEAFVAQAVGQGWAGVEALSGIPGSAGAAPIQNIGAYGQEVAETIEQVRVWDRQSGTERRLPAADCGFGYRTSRFKQNPQRYVVVEITFRLPRSELGAPLRYAELARTLGVEAGGRVPAVEVRQAVLALRRGKGMVLDPSDHDTWSAGSFFTNPQLRPEQAERLPAGAPRWPLPDGTVKTSAAWLIEQAGYVKGHGAGRVRLSGKHPLALTNCGGATTAELLDLAREVRAGVRAAFGVELVPEPVLVGCTL